MKRTILTVILVTILAFCLTACGCEHEWKEATCTTPRTCTLCGKTEGEVTEHQWQDATCLDPMTCKDCGATEGDVADHTWEIATCTTPKTCKICKETSGKEWGHDYEDTILYDYVSAEALTIQTCSRCKDNNATSAPLSTLHDGEYFLMSPAEFTDRLANTMVTLVEEFRSDGVDFRSEYLCFADRAPTEPACMIYLTSRVDGNDETITNIGYLYPIKDDNLAMLINYKDDRGEFICVRGPVQEDDASFVMLALIKTLEPTADNTEAWELYEKWAQTGFTKSNGLVYTWLPGKEPNTINLAIYIG